MDWLSVLICPWEAGTIRFQFPRSLMYRSLYSSRNPTISFNLIHILDCIYERRKRNVNKFIFPRYTVSFLSIFPLFFFIDRFFDSFFTHEFLLRNSMEKFYELFSSLLLFSIFASLRFVLFRLFILIFSTMTFSK